MKIYQIDSSARKEGSTSRQLSKKLLNKIKKPGDEIIYRDLDDEMLFISKLTESGMKIPLEKQTEDHKKMFELSDKLVLELKESDIIIISAPIYNFGPPATLKAWSDLAARADTTFKYTPDGKRIGLLNLANRITQEIMTSQIINAIHDNLNPIGVGVVIEADHHCMKTRGVYKKNSLMITSQFKGSFLTDEKLRNRFLDFIKD